MERGNLIGSSRCGYLLRLMFLDSLREPLVSFDRLLRAVERRAVMREVAPHALSPDEYVSRYPLQG